MIDKVNSVNNIPIRFTEERWFHIIENHTELAGFAYEILDTVKNPQLICSGPQEELLAVKKINGKYLVVIYKEFLKSKDGFIITAFITSRINQIKKKGIIWEKH